MDNNSDGSTDPRFPLLNDSQIARLRVHGEVRSFGAGETLVEPTRAVRHLYVLLTGRLEGYQIGIGGETVFATLEPGMFTGELNMLTGRHGLVRIKAAEDSSVLAIERNALLDLLKTDSELGNALLVTFIARRLALVEQGIGEIVLVGSNHSADTFRIKDFLTRNISPTPSSMLRQKTPWIFLTGSASASTSCRS